MMDDTFDFKIISEHLTKSIQVENPAESTPCRHLKSALNPRGERGLRVADSPSRRQ